MDVRYDPFERMEQMFEQMRRSMWGGSEPFWSAPTRGLEGGSREDANVSLETTDDGYVVLADLPGFEREEIDLRFDDGVLTISARHEVDEERETEGGFVSSHRDRRVFERLSVPGEVIEDEIEATYRNGVLEVHLPAVEDVSGDDEHHIEIN